jgi:hypothetical protein
MSRNYSVWFGRSVVLQIDAGESKLPLRGKVVGESGYAIRFRLEGRWDVDVPKKLVFGYRTWPPEVEHPRLIKASQAQPPTNLRQNMTESRRPLEST